MSIYYYFCQYILFIWLHIINVNIFISDSLSSFIRDIKKDARNIIMKTELCLLILKKMCTNSNSFTDPQSLTALT